MGMSSLLTGGRRSKEDGAFEAVGTIDELSSFLGVAHANGNVKYKNNSLTTTMN